MPAEAFVIVGASLAGASAAATLRKEGFDGRIVLIGDESEWPYERPSLSKDYLRGETGRHNLYVHGDTYYVEHEIDLRRGVRATAIEPASREVVLADGERVRFDRLLLATGSEPRRLPIPGADLEGVLTLRTIPDADAIREAALHAKRVVVIGGGWIGAEVAASLRQLGRAVALVAPSAVPLERVLGPEVGAVYRDLHAEHGVDLYPNQRVTSIEGTGGVTAVVTADGTRIEGDVVIVGIGAEPRTDLAAAAGLEVGDGVVVDEHLQASQPGIYAAGDIAGAWHPILRTRIRIEHWDNAKRQGPAAARNMLGHGKPYERIPYFYSDQYDTSMEYAGHATEWDRVVFRGDPGERRFMAFYLKDGVVLAGLNLNVDKVNPAISKLVASGRPVDAGRLADPNVPIEDIDALVAGSA